MRNLKRNVIESDSSTNREQFFFYITHFPFITFYYYDVVRNDAMHLINNHTKKNFFIHETPSLISVSCAYANYCNINKNKHNVR